MPNVEHLTWPDGLECRQEGDGLRLSGVIVRYGQLAPSYNQLFEAGAFAPVEQQDVLLNLGHTDRLLARTGGGGLTLFDTPTELRFEAVLAPTPTAQETHALVQSKVLVGASAEFFSREERAEAGRRVISLATLVGLGIVARPAFPDSRVQARQEGPRKVRRLWLG